MVAPDGMTNGDVNDSVGINGISGGGFVLSPNDRVSPGIFLILITLGGPAAATGATDTLLTDVSNGGVFLRA